MGEITGSAEENQGIRLYLRHRIDSLMQSVRFAPPSIPWTLVKYTLCIYRARLCTGLIIVESENEVFNEARIVGPLTFDWRKIEPSPVRNNELAAEVVVTTTHMRDGQCNRWVVAEFEL